MSEVDDKTKELMSKLENGIKDTLTSERYMQFLQIQSQFHTYSFNNAMLIFLQRPDATRVAGFKSWQKLGRFIKKGEHGISILAPSPYKYNKWVEKRDSLTKEPIKDLKRVMVRFDYEEAELLNAFLESSSQLPDKDSIINRLIASGSENDNHEITAIAKSTVIKLQNINDQVFNHMLSSLPVDTYTIYR